MTETRKDSAPHAESLHKRNIISRTLDNMLNKMGLRMKEKLIIIFLVVKVIPLILLALISWLQFSRLGDTLRDISVNDSSVALNNNAIENIERMTTDTANEIAEFLYDCDDDILLASSINPSESNYRFFINSRNRSVIKDEEWVLSEDGMSWVEKNPRVDTPEIVESSNPQNNDNDGFNYRPSENFAIESKSLYDEISFVDLNGVEHYKYVSTNSLKSKYPLSTELKDVSKRDNTYVKAETYFENLKKLKPGEIYVSDVVGAYVPSHFIGMYTPKQMVIAALNAEINALTALKDESSSTDLKEIDNFNNSLLSINETIPKLDITADSDALLMKAVADEAISAIEKATKGLDSEEMVSRKEALVEKIGSLTFNPEMEAFAGKENPMGQKFEGIVRFATPVMNDEGKIMGYVTLALNQRHLSEFVDRITPMYERYIRMPSAFEGNYAFIWDYQCRSIAHPRHHSIVGFEEETGNPQVPWLESSIYNDWQESGKDYVDFIYDVPTFDNQSREKVPAPELTKQGLIGLDGRYLNNAPQCTGWMDLTSNGGSGSFYILWSGLYKLTTAGTIPYYTGQYADSPRGFGFVSIGAGLEDFTRPAVETEQRLNDAIVKNTADTILQLAVITLIILIFVIFIAIWLASFLTDNIMSLITGISKFRSGERQFRFNAPVKDEFGTLADSFDDLADGLDSSVDSPIVIMDNDMKIIYFNEHAMKLKNTVLEEVKGKSYFDYSIYVEGSNNDPIRALEEKHEAEVIFVESTGQYFQGSASYFFDNDGNSIGYIVRYNDMTEMVRRQHELQKAVEEANKANEHKSNFLARMSHEIRTPMNAIIGVTNMVQKKIDKIKGRQPEIVEIKTNIDQIETSSQHLLGLLNDILDISKIEAGKIELSHSLMDIDRLKEIITDIIKPRCDEKNIDYITNFDVFEPGTFMSDTLRLRQVLINLLGNAVKFTPELGKIEFNASLLDRKEGKSLIRFVVKDSGIGIAEDQIDNIFEAFEQADASVSRKYGGTGLGLAISQKIVNLFGGEITINSEVGKGSEFSFEIWLDEEREEVFEKVEIENVSNIFSGKKALLVDDVDINRLIVMSLLEETSIELVEAKDGSEAVEIFKDSSEGDFDIILMDIRMPIMDGYEASEMIRSLDREDAKIVPIIALTANAFKEDIDKARASGMNSHLAKPIEIESLLETMLKHLSKNKS